MLDKPCRLDPVPGPGVSFARVGSTICVYGKPTRLAVEVTDRFDTHLLREFNPVTGEIIEERVEIVAEAGRRG